MAKKFKLTGDTAWNYVHAATCPRQALIDAEWAIKDMLDLKRENFNLKESKDQQKVLQSDPYHNDVIGYHEEIKDGLVDVMLSEKFCDIAKAHNLFHKVDGRLVANDYKLISALAERSQAWSKGGKNRADMPAFAVDGETRKAWFVVSQTYAKMLTARKQATERATPKRTESVTGVLPYSASVVVTENEDPKQVQGQKHNEDVAKAQASDEASRDLENSRLKAALAKAEAENARLLSQKITEHEPLVMPKTPSIAAPEVPNGIVH